jgi:class 3 adenylate cyclase
MDIGGWLRGLGLERYEQAFRENEIDEEVLPGLTADDLKDLGVALVGHRRRLLDAIAALAAAQPAAVASAREELGAAVSAEAERRQLTVMFCDLVGSTPLSTRFDPEDLREIVGAYHRCVADTVGRFGGFVAKYMGDGVLIYFGYPEAHEDDAERAVRVGLAVIDAVGRLATQEPLNVRIGIATGLVVVGDLIGAGAAQERGVVGETPNLAARLQALARPGTLREATAGPNCPEAVVAHRVSGCTCWYFGDFAAAHDHFRKTVELYDQTHHGDFANRFGHDPRATAEILDALALWVLGRIDDSLRLADHALADAESAAHAPTMAFAHYHRVILSLVRGNPKAVATISQMLADIVSRYDLPAFLAGWAAFFQGWATWSDGAGESRLAEMRRGLAIEREQGYVLHLPILEAALAEAEASAGDTDGGLRRLDDALAGLESTEHRWYEAEMHRLRGEIMLKCDPADTAAAEQSLQAVIAIA